MSLFIIPFISILVNEFSREVSGFVRQQFSFLSLSSIMKFQFQYGSIKRLPPPTFNGMMLKFQFQFGAIKRDSVLEKINNYEKFQFQFGAIKRRLGIIKTSENL